jgi:N-formylglutamate deformylase
MPDPSDLSSHQVSPPAYSLTRGHTPLLLSLPHVGTLLPDALRPRLQPRALQVEDTDWHLERLYGFAAALGASVLVPRYSRIVVDLNRPPENVPMYPGVNNTELCPTRFFTGDAIYLPGQAPDEAEVRARVDAYWMPYHQALQAELARLKTMHGHAVLFDGHSIKSRLPWLFEGRLWDLNLGTVDGSACAPSLQAAVAELLAGQSSYSQVVNGRFKGGHITRRYGQPAQGVHAVQLEMAWCCYMDEEPPYAWRPDLAERITPLLERLLTLLRDWRPGPTEAAGPNRAP